MKKILILLLSILCLQIQAEENSDPWALDADDPFLDASCPVLDGFSMWIFRQKLASRGIQIMADTQWYQSPAEELAPALGFNRVEAYAGVLQSERIDLMLGGRFIRNSFISQNWTEETPFSYEQLWYFSSLKLKLNPRNYIQGHFEYGFQGEAIEGNELLGDYYMGTFQYLHSFSPSLHLIAFGIIQNNFMDGEEYLSLLPAAEIRYQPSSDFKVIGGFPYLAGVEWAVTDRLQLAGKLFVTMESAAMLRYRISPSYSLSLLYQRSSNKSSKLFFQPYQHYLESTDQWVSFNNITQVQNRITLELGVEGPEHTAFIISGGIILAEEALIHNNQSELDTLPGGITAFMGCGFRYLNL